MLETVSIRLELICGMLFGFEIIPQYETAMIDFLCFRILIDWSGEEFI